ncbi:gastrula zinc finger protein XlCGF8.2DB-like [Argiope bruennichi]|uniref:gastrula zinc finger protein XlCGF8.2DB-like n=1 Tax=Argiope bruennichi TaxID=94029 RepID=UPI0024952AA0|nr:gastrula zinc finger protein XlCGF8.2DB-like [Argiope bruennichi]
MENDAVHICDSCKENTDASENKSKNYEWVFLLESSFQCVKCSKYFSIGFRVTDTISLFDPSKNSVQELIAGRCENVCGEYCSRTEHRIQESQPAELKEKPYKCDVSPRTFKVRTSQVCNVQFTYKSYYQNHLSKNSKEKPYKCSFCTAAYKHKQSLTAHMNIHDDQNNFRCELCKKIFATKHELESHMASHSNERPFKCAVCHSTYKTQTNFIRHMNVHKEQNPYRCEVCNRNCSSKTELKNHMMIHNEARPYKCNICSWSFKREFNLIRHMKMRHQNHNLK